jgi:hypothetical protein
MPRKKNNFLDDHLIVMGLGSKKNKQIKSLIQNKLMSDFLNGKYETKKEVKKNVK